MKKLMLTLLILLTPLAFADNSSPEGTWRTIDDETGEPKSLVSVWIENGELKGRIEKLLNPSEPNPTCEECKGERKDQPIEGMTFLWGLSQKGDSWKGGTILDPANGKEYKAKVTLTEDGTLLDVRGYIGLAAIGRTQTWQRVE
ncbi:DUF2147 domain-containing protein [Reinekea marinisedimentorum]|nr:DUF2147 domain-containing protein [Reinekea marinisedimentorum]